MGVYFIDLKEIINQLREPERYDLEGILDEVKNTFNLKYKQLNDGEAVLEGFCENETDFNLLLLDVLIFVEDIKSDFEHELSIRF